MAEIARVRELAKALCLMNTANGTIDLTDETVSNLDYICRIFEQEVNYRKANRVKELLTLSRLPEPRSITAAYRPSWNGSSRKSMLSITKRNAKIS